MTTIDRTLCVAPMMDWTDRHCRYFLRLISPNAFLFTEMVTARAVIHGHREHLLGFSPQEHPLAVQLGGSDPEELAQAARICEDFGYDEINLNVGCPSDRVKSGMFGACLMAHPALVGRCIAAMQKAVTLPVTVKCRIGIDEQDTEADLNNFISIVSDAGCSIFYIHARKAWLQGLSPKENRTVPPLDYDRVYRLKQNFPNLQIILNGGIETCDTIPGHLEKLDGVMLGRAAYHNPWILAQLEQLIFEETSPSQNREAVLEKLIPYAGRYLEQGNIQIMPTAQGQSGSPIMRENGRNNKLHSITRHISGLYAGQPGARAYRRYLSQETSHPDTTISALEKILETIRNEKQKQKTHL